ncbi:signal recognition particle, SRP19 subunit [Syncephalis pseudoplumigaleata]|uniref:Signal recognition particle, SRP19 subunit n=1 Tax=Syncephalis pseudoplumigaleata TaxID=1712513 RepID=A0A4P9Z1S8_9FUNG|nr:signal recognition particle, SRP19 subunit [Syncephalis pseudoplumigaleata]|eukprot:RKP26305.1 signal recognition particle, SRP19 subunit [Syncephalis pseudoplumigaleata]
MSATMDDIDVDDMDYALTTTTAADDQVHHVEGYGQVRYVESDALFKDWVCLYPVYFDAGRSLGHGRKVPRSLAYANPDARAIVEACKKLRLHVAFEPHKMHPRDFGVLGRVRVQLKINGRPAQPTIPHRKALMRQVGALLPDIQPQLPPAPSQVPPEWAALTEALGGGSSAAASSAKGSETAESSSAEAAAASSATTSSAKSAKKKKGKKGRR